MLRYCPVCDKKYDFKVKNMMALNELSCPECGNKIPENYGPEESKRSSNKLENDAIAKGYISALRIAYVYYAVLSIIGIVAFYFQASEITYSVTGVCLLTYVVTFLLGLTCFPSGVLFLPIGAVCGFIYFHSMAGICVGVLIVFLIRHLVRDILLTLLFSFFRWVAKVS